jgi:hypothetical protein
MAVAIPAALLLLGLTAAAVANLLYPTPTPSTETGRLAEPEKVLLAEAIHLRQTLGDDGVEHTLVHGGPVHKNDFQPPRDGGCGCCPRGGSR